MWQVARGRGCRGLVAVANEVLPQRLGQQASAWCGRDVTKFGSLPQPFRCRCGWDCPSGAEGRRRLASTSTAAASGNGFGKGERRAQAFDTLDVNHLTLRALEEVFRYPHMTDVQAFVLPELLKDRARAADAVVRARTGTGKTLTYLLPSLEQLLRHPPPGVGVLVVAPNRELALQITREVEMLCTYHALQVVPLIGGVRRDRDEAMIKRRRPSIIVGTPGRLVEHLESTFRFQSLFEAIQTLVLDECDKLLEDHTAMVRELLAYLPDKGSRRSLLLSATISNDVEDLATRVCKEDYLMLDCVKQGIATQEGVQQHYIVCAGMLLLTALRNALFEEATARPLNHKIMVFLPTARFTAFVAKLFRDQLRAPVHEIHGRCDGPSRMLTQQAFSNCTAGILLTSSVSERGMDYPDVTLVVQVLTPESREHYIHRAGRTARAGKSGRSLLILLDHEADGFLARVRDLPLTRHPDEARFLHDEGERLANAASSATWATAGPLPAAAAAAFASLLKYYRGQLQFLQLGADETVEAASEVLLGCGLAEPPAISHRLAEELGLLHCPNLRIEAPERRGWDEASEGSEQNQHMVSIPAAGHDLPPPLPGRRKERRPRRRRGDSWHLGFGRTA